MPASNCLSLLQRALLVFILACVGGCGWHLQGVSRLSDTAANAYIDSVDVYTDFNRALRRTLNASGARLVADGKDAGAIVRIRKDESGRRVLSVSARNTPEEYEVFYRIEYSVESNGQVVIEPQTLELTRDYSFDETAVLAKQREEAILREALARELADLVVRRLASL